MSSVRVPSHPFMHADQIQYLQERLEQTKCFLEYGAGGSTRLAARLGVHQIFSVESDRDYAKKVRRSALADRPALNLTMKAPDIGTTGPWGRPVNNDKFQNWPEYSIGIWNVIRESGHTPDLVLVDGRFRVACFAASMIFCKEGTEILFDDFIGREKKYGAAATLCQPTRIIEKMAVFHVPSNRSFPDLSAVLARYSCIPG